MRLTSNLKSALVFLISFTAVFLMVIIPHFRQRPDLFANPFVRPDPMDKIRPLLFKTGSDNFKLKLPGSFPPAGKAAEDFENASSFGVVDFKTGQVLEAKNLSARLPIASLTKLMTAAVALDLAQPDEVFTISEKAANEPPTKVMLKAGEKYNLTSLLSFMLISSANDSAEAVKDGIDEKYGDDVFIRAMNAKAKILGLKNTGFTNPMGLDGPGHFSSVEDLILLTHYVLTKYPLIANIVSRQIDDRTNNGSDMRFYLQNWNGLLGLYPGVNGVKIGNTENAGYTTIVHAQRDNKDIMAVVLGAPGVPERDLWASRLLDLGFTQEGLAPVNLTSEDLTRKYSRWKYFN